MFTSGRMEEHTQAGKRRSMKSNAVTSAVSRCSVWFDFSLNIFKCSWICTLKVKEMGVSRNHKTLSTDGGTRSYGGNFTALVDVCFNPPTVLCHARVCEGGNSSSRPGTPEDE